MLVVKIELWPLGDKSKAVEISRVKIGNDGTGTLDCGNYNVALFDGTELHKWGRVEGFPREKLRSWDLVRSALNTMLADCDGSEIGSGMNQKPSEQRLSNRETVMSAEKVLDCVGREIKPGCTILYPVRRGSDMWQSSMKVQQATVQGGKPSISGFNDFGRRVNVTNVKNVVVVVPLGQLYEPSAN